MNVRPDNSCGTAVGERLKEHQQNANMKTPDSAGFFNANIRGARVAGILSEALGKDNDGSMIRAFSQSLQQEELPHRRRRFLTSTKAGVVILAACFLLVGLSRDKTW
jgi:hypothetical protein